MSGLIKWRGKPEDISEPRRMVELVRRSPEIETRNGEAQHELTTPPGVPTENTALSRAGVALPDPLELHRHCCIYDGEISLARYILRNGVYEFNTSIEVTPQQRSRYASGNVIRVPSIFENTAERCACCGTWTLDDQNGSVWCSRHNGGRGAWVCFGRTSRSGFFNCSKSCGASGQLHPYAFDRVGLVPGRRSGNFAGHF
jgi:hypothetical protein